MAQQGTNTTLKSTAVCDVATGGNAAGTVVEYDFNNVLQLLATCPEHIRSLSLKVEHAQFNQVRGQLRHLNRPASILEDLVVEVIHPSNANLPLGPPRVSLPRKLFPSLRSLTLDGLFIDQGNDLDGVIRHLRILKLWNHPPFAPALPSNELMAVLSNALSLRTLHIYRFLFAVDFQVTNPRQHLHQLPSLVNFICEDAIHSVCLFLQGVDIGVNVRAEITAHLPGDYAPDPTAMFGPVCMVVPSYPGPGPVPSFENGFSSNHIEYMYTERNLNPDDPPADYEPVGWIFPSEETSPTLLTGITHLTLSRSSTGAMELVGRANAQDPHWRLMCRIPARTTDSPLLKYHLMGSALTTICAHFAIQRAVNLLSLKVTAELDFIRPSTWRQLLHSTPFLTDLEVEDTGRQIAPLSMGAVILFVALGSTTNPETGDPVAFRKRPNILKRLARSSPSPDIAASRLERVVLRGSMVSVPLIETIHATLAGRERITPAGRTGVLKDLRLELHASDTASATAVQASQKYSALVQLAAQLGTNLFVSISVPDA